MPNDRIERLQRIKAQRELSYEQLAQELGVSFMSVYRWIKRRSTPKNRLVLKSIDRLLAKYGSP